MVIPQPSSLQLCLPIEPEKKRDLTAQLCPVISWDDVFWVFQKSPLTQVGTGMSDIYKT